VNYSGTGSVSGELRKKSFSSSPGKLMGGEEIPFGSTATKKSVNGSFHGEEAISDERGEGHRSLFGTRTGKRGGSTTPLRGLGQPQKIVHYFVEVGRPDQKGEEGGGGLLRQRKRYCLFGKKRRFQGKGESGSN